jgi:membrane protease YdiL (CAAX protease family)
MFKITFDIAKEIARHITIIEITCFVGVTLFAVWLVKTSWGRKALADSIPRRNNMPAYLPFMPVLFWLGMSSIADFITLKLTMGLEVSISVFFDNLALCTVSSVTIILALLLARETFARRLKGFGINIKTIHKDFLAACVNLLSAWPLMLAMVIITTFVGKLIWGQQYQIEQHQELEMITTYTQLPVRISIIFLAVVIAPAMEETLFRGLFQTIIRSFLEIRNSRLEIQNGAWLAIVICSVLFAMVHSNIAHWPALFVLGMFMGYSYEKSGSLFRSIFIHSLFNAIAIVAVLNQ